MSNGSSSHSAATGESKSRITKKLPTFRAGVAKQFDALRAYALLSENGAKAVHYSKVAEVIDVHEANTSSMNPFFLEAGFIEKRDNGYAPTPPVLEYHRQYSWNQETAAQKLAPIIANSWFGQALGNRLQFRSMSDDDAIEMLAGECNAGPEARPQLRMLLEYSEASGILDRANGQISAPPAGRAAAEPKPSPVQEKPPAETATSSHPSRSSAHAALPMQDGISLNIQFQVSLAEMRDWSADRIAAFFAGIAQVLAAKNADGK
jgi:hypothetical protein